MDLIKHSGDVEVNVDTNIQHGPLTELEALKAEINAIDEIDATIEVHVDAFKAIREAEELNKEIDAVLDEHKEVKVKVDTSGLSLLQKAVTGATDSLGGGGGGMMGGLIGAAILAGPAITGIAVAATGAAAGLVGAFGAMGAGIGAFAIFAMPIMSKVSAGLKAITAATKGLSGQKKIDALNKALQGVDKTVRPLVKEIYNFKDAIAKAGKAVEPKIVTTFVTAIKAAKSVLGDLAPIAGHVAGALTKLFKEARAGLQGRDWQKFFTYLDKNVGHFIKQWGRAIGNFVTGIANMIRAFNPLSKFVTHGFSGMSKSFLKWSEGLKKDKGFQNFVAMVKQDGPQVWQLIKNIGKVLIDLGKALSGMKGINLKNLNDFLTWVDNFVKTHQKLVGMIATFAGLFLVLKPIVGILSPIAKGFGKILSSGIGKIAELFGSLGEEGGILAPILSGLGGPIGIIAGVLLAFGGALAFTTKKGKPFHEMIKSLKGVWDGLKNTVSDVVGVFKTFWGILMKTNDVEMFQGAIKDLADAFKEVLPNLKPLAIFLGGALLVALTVVAYGFRILAKVVKWTADVFEAVTKPIVKAWDWVYERLVGHSIIPDLVKGIKHWFSMIPDFIKRIIGDVRDWIVKKWDEIKSAVSDAVHSVIHAIEHPFSTIQGIVRKALDGLPDSVRHFFGQAHDAVVHVLTSLVHDAGRIASNVIDSIKHNLSRAKSAVTGAFSGAGKWLWNAGKNIIGGLVSGIGSMIGKVQGMLGHLTSMIPKWKGPKAVDLKLLEPTGQWIMQGLVKGLEHGSAGVQNFLTKLTALIQKTMNNVFKNNQIAADATKAVTNSLKPYAQAINEVGKQYDRVSTAIDNQVQKLKALQQARAQYAKNVQSSIVDYGSVANVTGQTVTDAQGNQSTAPVTATDIITQMTQKLAAAKNFSGELKKLISLGINKTTLDQLQQMGVDAGSATAQAIIDGGKGTVDQINKLTEALKKTGADMGNRVAKQMYQSGIQSVNGVIRGLKSRRRALIHEARQLARDMNKAFREALHLEVAGGGKLTGDQLASDPGMKKIIKNLNNQIQPSDTHASNKKHHHGGEKGKGDTHVHVYIGDKELKHIVKTEVGDVFKPLKKKTRTGAGKK